MTDAKTGNPTGGSNEETFVKVTSRKRKSKMDDVDMTETAKVKRPQFPPLSGDKLRNVEKSIRYVPVPSNRYTPLKENWMKIFTPIVEHLKLQVRFNLKTRNVELQTCKETSELSALQKAEDFIKAFVLGFSVDDALALVRLDELFLESFDVTDVKNLKGDHLSRAIAIPTSSDR